MKRFYAYIRVSSLKQGEKGVSLQEQRSAIELYAKKHDLHICEWFEEQVTAAKKGRPGFMKMMKGLRAGRADGVIIHKIDRSTRNLRDWADLGDLIDAGVAVHFANESLDLRSRGGRLAADIQAVVASDYVRNLREETRKGLYGRLKQGIYPFQAPLGYLDTGSGNLKSVDPVRGPLVRQAFELYVTGRYTIDTLLVDLHRKGLRNWHGREVSRNGISKVLNNPFYAGLIRIRKTGDTFPGGHVALIPMNLFTQVRARLVRRLRTRRWVHDFTLRGLFQCSLCQRFLIGEIQKGHVYYRCHTLGCPTRTFREEVLEAAMMKSWTPIASTAKWRKRLLAQLEYVQQHDGEDERTKRNAVELQISASKARLTRLIDAFIDGTVDKPTFDERKRTLLEDQQSLADSLHTDAPDSESLKRMVMELLELASSAEQSYRFGSSASRRELAIRLCSNRSVAEKQVSVEPCFPLSVVAKRDVVTGGGDHRYATRTERRAAEALWEWAKDEIRKSGASLETIGDRAFY